MISAFFGLPGNAFFTPILLSFPAPKEGRLASESLQIRSINELNIAGFGD